MDVYKGHLWIRRFISGIKNLNLNNLNYQLFKFYMESTRGYLNFSLVLSSCYIKSICSHLNLTHRPYTINAIFVLLLFKIAISASCLLRRLYKIYMVWPSLLFKIYVPRHINFINGYIHFILFSYYSHLIYAISHILFTRPTERTALETGNCDGWWFCRVIPQNWFTSCRVKTFW